MGRSGPGRSEEPQHGQDAAVVRVDHGQVKLGEDVVDVLRHGALADHQRLRDAGIGAPLGHQAEHLPFAGGVPMWLSSRFRGRSWFGVSVLAEEFLYAFVWT